MNCSLTLISNFRTAALEIRNPNLRPSVFGFVSDFGVRISGCGLRNSVLGVCLLVLAFTCALNLPAQRPDGGPDFGGPPAFGPGFGRGGPGGMGGVRAHTELVKKFDKNGDGWLNKEERQAARDSLNQQGNNQPFRGPGGRRGGFGRFGANVEPAKPGPHVAMAEVKSFPDAPLYASNVLRTFFLEFENADWEKELEDFHGTDVDVPAKLTVDGKTYREVGVHFRGASSYFMVSAGHKRSLNLALDLVHHEQRLGGYRTLNLLNSHEDASFLRTVLYGDVARHYLPAPKANFVRLVINGESWGVYVNAQQFNKDFVQEWFGAKQGARWKVPGSPNGRGGLNYLGEDPAPYKRIYDLRSKDETKPWADFVHLCKVLNQTPSDKLEAALAPLLDIDGALKFLALDNALMNNDGVWTRASDYNIYQDPQGRFHLIPYDANETFSLVGGPGGPGGRGGRRGPGGFGFGGARVNGAELDPLIAANDTDKPILSKLLAVPSLRTRYLAHIRDIAETWLDWKQLGPLVAQYQALISDQVKADTRKFDSFEDFTRAISGESTAQSSADSQRSISLKNFADQRRAYLLNYPEIKKLVR
jgi:spore coat protein CotH